MASGLSIVQDIVHTHNATLEVLRSEELGGAQFRIRFGATRRGIRRVEFTGCEPGSERLPASGSEYCDGAGPRRFQPRLRVQVAEQVVPLALTVAAADA